MIKKVRAQSQDFDYYYLTITMNPIYVDASNVGLKSRNESEEKKLRKSENTAAIQ